MYKIFHSHEGLVVVADLEDVEVVLGIDELLHGAVVRGDGHHARQVLEAALVVHAHLAQAAVRVPDLEDAGEPVLCAHLGGLWKLLAAKIGRSCG